MSGTASRAPLSAASARAPFPYTASHVANYFLGQAKRERRDLSHLKLQKLVYIAYGWCWEILGRPLFSDPIEAWRYGPVVPDLYHEFKHCGWQPIRRRSAHYDFEAREFIIPEVQLDGRVAGVLHKVWEAHKPLSAEQLRNMTRGPGTPWSDTYEPDKNHRIGDEQIREHFAEKHKRYKKYADSALRRAPHPG